MFERASRRGFMAALVGLAALGPVGLGLASPASAQSYPDRPITFIVPWSAGGGSDAVGRIIANLLEKEFGQPVNVVNRTGGNGVVGHQAIASARPDGYTIGLVTAEINMMHHQGLTQLTFEAYRPLALMNSDPAAIHVAANSKFDNARQLLDAIKEGGTPVKFSGSGQGSIWHLAMAGMLSKAGIAPSAAVWVPSQGAAPAMQELAAGGVDVVTSSMPEGAAMIAAKRAKTIGLMAEQRDPSRPDVPTLKEETGIDWTLAASTRGIVAPKGTPEEIARKLEAALKKIYDSPEYIAFMEQRDFGREWQDSAQFGAFMATKDQQFGEVLKAAGMIKQ